MAAGDMSVRTSQTGRRTGGRRTSTKSAETTWETKLPGYWLHLELQRSQDRQAAPGVFPDLAGYDDVRQVSNSLNRKSVHTICQRLAK